ncbi:MAG: hypothetical protein KC635_10240, partial [Myxococcales bacterium]|nr:hypothetical protein [Myxococcales bacterium]
LGACGDDGSNGGTDTATGVDTDASGGDTNTGDTGPADTSADTGDDDTTETDTADAADGTSPGDADASDTEDAGDTAADTSGDADTSNPPSSLETRQLGARMWSPPLQLSRTGRTLWVGTRGASMPMDWERIRGGLYRYDLDTGATRVYESELPIGPYYEDIDGPVNGIVPVAGVHEDVDRYVVVAIDGLLTLAGDSISRFPVTSGGEPVVPTHLEIARDGVRPVAWMTSDHGLLRLDEDTFAVESVLETPETGVTGQWGALTVDPDTGDCYAAFYPVDGGSGSRVVRVTVAGDVSTITPGEGGVPEGLVAELVWSASDGRAYVSLAAWAADQGGVIAWDGTTTTVIALEGQLSKASDGDLGPFGAYALALDDDNHVLAVGGRILGNPIGPSKGGGLAWIDLTGEDRIAGLSAGDTPFVALHVQSLAMDPTTHRTFALLSGQCNEVHLRAGGLFGIAFDADGKPRLERPLLSGVRAVVSDDDGVRLGLRDDYGGLACDGYPIENGVHTLASNGAGVWVPVVTDEQSPIGVSLAPGITAMVAGASADALAIGTGRDGVVYGPPEAVAAENPTTWRASLDIMDVAFRADTEKGGGMMWLATRTTHNNSDPVNLADVGPHGAARVAINDRGDFAGATHYVRTSNLDTDVKGLPSSDVRDVLLADDGTAYLACALERENQNPFDRAEEDVFKIDDLPRKGGVAHILSDDTVQIVTDATETPDPRVLAFDADGALIVGDAQVGVVRVTESGVAPVTLPGTVPGGAIPRALWFGEGGDMAVGYDKGLLVSLGGAVRFVDTVGFVWTIVERDGALLVGTDEGLLVVARDEAGLTLDVAAPPTPGAIPFETIHADGSGGTGGECLGAGEVCQGNPEGCCAGLSCGGSGFVLMCQ